MFCPKCGTALKEGAKFCHVCGFNTGETPVVPQPQQPAQPEQQYQPATPPQTNYQQPAGAGFDISKITLSTWIIAGAATLGALCTFLPWVSVSVGGWGRNSVLGIESIFGVLSLLTFLGIAGVAMFGKAINFPPALCEKIISFGGIGTGTFCLIDIIRFIARSGNQFWGVSVSITPGFGLIVAIMASVGIILFGFKVIKLK